ncbi:hypothetical protein [Staphylococcus aureus]|uniref:hypothetical protein n=1 Tax=Staphylococcus aureus TaxID=1280 RepID=UPI001CC63889|nr:hypothetical protein [Staphylococcus aureus]MBZ5280607.1 hypothetical protein [Staphylococcus aureus]
MSNLKDLNYDSITNANDIKIPFLIAFTYSDEYLDTFKREDKAWKVFEKQFSVDREKENYYVVTDIKIDSEDPDEPFKNKTVALVTKDALPTITEKDKETLEFGVRVVDEEAGIARYLDKDMLEYFELGNVNSKVHFDEIESVLDDVMVQTKQLSTTQSKQQESRELHEQEEDEQNSDNTDSSVDESEYETFDDSTNNKDEQNSNYVLSSESSELSKEKPIEQPESKNEQPPIPAPDTTSNVDSQSKEPETPFERAQADLKDEIAKFIPEIQIPNSNEIPDEAISNLKDYPSYGEFVSLKSVTESKLEKRSESTNKYLNNLRQDAILKVFNKLNRRLIIENEELLRRKEVTSNISPFNESYNNLEKNYQNIIDAIPETKQERVEQNRINHERDKKAYVDRAAEIAAKEFDDNYFHLIEDSAQEYVEEIRNDADSEYQKNQQILETDADNWYIRNFNSLVPKIIQSSKDEIEKIGQDVNQAMQDSIYELRDNMEKDMEQFKHSVTQIINKRIETDERNEELINKKVHERTIEYPELQHAIENLKKEKSNLEKENNKLFEEKELERRNYYSEQKRNESLEQALSNRNKDVNASRDDYHHILSVIADGKSEKLQKILEADKVTPIKETFFDKLKGWTNVIAAAIIALGIVIGMLLMGGANNDDSVSKDEVQTQVKQAVKETEQQKDEQNAKAQEESNKQIDQLKKDLEDEKKKNDKKDSKKD